jgi:twinkle protein
LSSIFGTAKSTQEADNVMIVQKNKKFRYISIKKNRFDGELGVIPYQFDKDSNRIIELTEEEIKNLD